MIKARRIYDKPEADDGFRILVDRIWPRGLKKNDLNWFMAERYSSQQCNKKMV